MFSPGCLFGNVFKQTVSLSVGHCYKIVVDAKTSAGFNSSLDQKPLTICMERHQLKQPREFSAMAVHVKNRTLVELNWTTVEHEPLKSYTIIWCIGISIISYMF